MSNNALQLVDLFNPLGKPIPGLIPVRGFNSSRLSIDERVAITDAESFNRIDFVFFRRFLDGRSSQILAYVVDNRDNRLDIQTLSRLHHQVWLHGASPLIYVAWPGKIDILACAREPDFWRQSDKSFFYNPAKSFDETLQVAAGINAELKRYSAFRLSDGTFWEEPNNAHLLNNSKAAHNSLIQAVVDIDADLEGNKNLILRRLLLLMILIKYLEDRNVFPGNGWFGKFCPGAKNFFEVLKNGDPQDVYRLLRFLETKFNGDVFALERGGELELSKGVLDKFAELVEARTLNNQRFLWDQFSFKHLPVEIISHLYQRFVDGAHGAVYTPPVLATLLLDRALPYPDITGDERVIDPACGSGVFLVGAFRRLVNVWRHKHGWRSPDVNTLKEILKKRIYGIELNPSAIDLTAFSLCLAICDALQPDVIWRDLRFDRLQKSNILKEDFFQYLITREQGGASANEMYDVVIGNPPFESSLSPAGLEINRKMVQQKNGRGLLPDNQNAYLFLEQAMTILRPGGRVCLIQPAGLLYNLKAQAFRRHLQRKNKIKTILDFTSIRGLFSEANADPKIIAVIANAAIPPENHSIDHLTFRRTLSVNERICFEIDHYDYHSVSQKQAEDDQYVWRLNLLGGGRLHGISQRLRKMRKLGEFVNRDGWDFGEGFIVADKMKRSPAPFLTGKPFLPTSAFTESGLDEKSIGTVKEKYFRSAYKESRYSSPLILIKETDSLPMAFWNKGFLAYRAKIVGIHSPSSDVAKLRKLYNFLHRNRVIYRFSCALNGIQALIGKATAITKHDIAQLPYPENPNDLSLAFWEEALCEDVLNYMCEYVRLGQDSELLQRSAKIADLNEYSTMFIRLLGSVYESLKASSPLFFNGLICQPFYFGSSPDIPWLQEKSPEELKGLIYDEQKHKRLRTARILCFYSKNVILIIKPDRLRYWIKSSAIRDADETLVDLRIQGY